MPSQQPAIRNQGAATAAATRWLRAHGYPDALPAQREQAPGVDVRSDAVLALVHHGTSAVNREMMQRLVAARGKDADVALYAFTSSRYELPALTYADYHGVQLLTYDEDGRIWPRDRGGRVLDERARRSPNSSVPMAWGAVFRHLPLLLAVYMYAIAATQLLALVRGNAGPVWGNVVFGVVTGTAFLALWLFLVRRARRAGSGGTAADTRPRGGGPPAR